MPENLMDSYLVKLSSSIDTQSFRKFDQVLDISAKSFGGYTLNVASNFAKLDLAIVGAFASLGSGIIALADKTAMADQSYRLMGLRMLMGKDAARAMSVATDELGASLDEIAYDPELNRRFQVLYDQNMKLTASLGAGFNKNMMNIRDLRMEYKRFETELEFLSSGVVSQMFEKAGLSSGDLLNKLDEFNDWFSDSLPKFADNLSQYLVPAWDDAVLVVKDFGDTLKVAGGDFVYLTNLLLGDGSIKSTEFTIQGAAKATQDWLDVLAELALTLQFDFKVAAHFATALGDAWGAASAFRRGDFGENQRLMAEGRKEWTAGTDDIKDFFHAPSWRAAAKYDSDFNGLAAYQAKHRAQPSETGMSSSANGFTSQTQPSLSALAAQLARRVSSDTGIPADIIFAQWMHETGKFSSRAANSLNNLAGIRVPGTLEYKNFGSLNDFGHYYEMLMRPGGRYAIAGALGAKSTDEFAHALKMGGYYTDSESNYAKGMRAFQPALGEYAGGGVTINGGLQITVPPGTHPDDVHRYIHDSMRDLIDDRSKITNQRVVAQTAAGAYN